jgi:hypothetical protein
VLKDKSHLLLERKTKGGNGQGNVGRNVKFCKDCKSLIITLNESPSSLIVAHLSSLPKASTTFELRTLGLELMSLLQNFPQLRKCCPFSPGGSGQKI